MSLFTKINTHFYKSLSKYSSLGLVTTMGGFHDGHVSQIKKSMEQNEHTLISIYVNPRQFNNKEDFEKYPRNLSRDVEMLLDKFPKKSLNSISILIPDHKELMKFHQKHDKELWSNNGFKTLFDQIDSTMEGPRCPGHLKGVCEIINVLNNIVIPERIYMGQKDFQQSKLVELISQPQGIETIVVDTVREPNGLAMSTRNQLLPEKELESLSIIHDVLNDVSNELQKNADNVDKILHSANATLNKYVKSVEYLKVVHDGCVTLELQELVDKRKRHTFYGKHPFVICCAVNTKSKVRLIDNMPLEVSW